MQGNILEIIEANLAATLVFVFKRLGIKSESVKKNVHNLADRVILTREGYAITGILVILDIEKS